jgi:FKBP-type peptidyl-prolyl cis-trans isomerase FkpA
MKNLLFAVIVLFLLMSCGTEEAPKTVTKIKKTNVADSIRQAEIDRKIIREYVALQTDMSFDSTKSGIFYHLENEGFGEKPTDSSLVVVHYDLYLIDGTLVHSTYEQGEASEFLVADLLKGWQESLQLLGATGSGTFVIPSGLAYGSGMNSKIPTNSILVFDIELLAALE